MFAECCDMQNMPLCMQNTPASCANAHASVDYWLLFPNLCKGMLPTIHPKPGQLRGMSPCVMPRLPVGPRSRYAANGTGRTFKILSVARQGGAKTCCSEVFCGW